MKRRTFLMKSMLGFGVLAGMANAGLAKAEPIAMNDAGREPGARSKETVGRPVRIVSISFAPGLPLEEIVKYVDQAGAAHADVIALQECDRRYGRRMAVLPLDAITHSNYVPVPLTMKPDSLGWHGNALLVRKGIELIEAKAVPLPVLEPRGAVRAELSIEGQRIRVIGMHLDLSGLRGTLSVVAAVR